MASPNGVFRSMGDSLDSTFPPADANGELNPRAPKEFPVDPVSSEIDMARKQQEQAEAERRKAREMAAKKKKKKPTEKKWEDDNGHNSTKSALIISGLVVAVIGVIFAVTKKLKEKPQ